MGFTQDFFTSRRNYSDGSTRVGQEGRIWYDSDTGSFRVGDGVSAGGSAIGTSQLYTAGIGLSVNQHTGNVTITSNATPLAIPNTIVSRDGNNSSYFQVLTSNILLVTGNLTVLGNSRFVDQQLLSITNKNLILANTSPAPSNFAANGGGLILLGTTNHTILWDEVTSTWESSENWSLIAGRYYAIDHVPVLTVNSVLSNASVANIAFTANTVRIGATTSNTIVQGNLQVDGNLTVTGSFPINRDYDYLNFDTTLANPAYLEGRLFYDNAEKCLSYYADATDFTLNIGQETVFRARNQSGVTLYSGNVVYITGATGNSPTIARARADNLATAQAVGVVTTLIPNNGFGYVTLNGVIHDVDTSGFSAGSPIYLSPTTAGEFVATRPNHPNYEVQIGFITRSNPSNGHFAIHLRNNSFSQLMVNGTANFETNVVIDQNLTVSNSVFISNTLRATGATTLLSTLAAGATVLSNLAVSNNGGIDGSFRVTGPTILNGTTSMVGIVSANTVLAGDTTLGNLIVPGTSTFTGNVNATTINTANINTTGNIVIGGALAVTNNLAVATNRFTVDSVSGDISVLGQATIGGNINLPNIVTVGPTSSDLRIGHVIGTTRVRNNLEVDGDIMIDGGYLNASTVAFNLLNSTTTIISAFHSATTLSLGALTGLTNIRNNVEVGGNLDINGNLNVDGSQLSVSSSSFKLANTVASTIDAFGSAQTINMGANGGFGQMRIRNDLVVLDGNLAVNSGLLSTTKTTFDLLPNTASTVNFASTASTINIGNVLGIGTTNVLHNMYIQGNLFVNGNDVTFNSAVSVVNDPVMILGGPPPASLDDNKDRGIQFTWHTGTAPRTGFFGWDDSQQVFTIIPDATNIGEIFTGSEGNVRFAAIAGTTGTFSSEVFVQGNLNVDSGRIISVQPTVHLIETSSTINIGAAATNITLGALTSSVNTRSNLEVRGTAITTTQTNFGLLNSTVTTGNLFGAASLVTIGSNTGTAILRNAVVQIDGDLEVRGGDITTNQTTFNLLNTTATTINMGAAATAINLGTTAGTIELRSPNLTTNQTNFNLLNTTATSLNFAGAASTINMGAAGGALTIRNDNVVLDGDLQIKGGDLTTNLSSFNLVNTNAIAVNAFGAATSLIMASSIGVTNIRNNLDIDGTLNIDGATITTGSGSLTLFNTVATNVSAFGAATAMTLGATSGSTTIRNKLNVSNDVGITGSVNINTNLQVDGTVNIDGAVDIDSSLDVLTNLVVGNNASIAGVLTLGAGFSSTLATFNLLNTFTTTINAFGAASLIEIGSSGGKTSINNELEVEGAAITTSRASIDLLNTTATTINFAGATTALTIGATTGTTRIRNNLDVDLDLNIDGGDLTVTGTTFNLANTTATTVNAFGAATALTVGATTGLTTIRNDLTVKGSLTVEGTVTTIDSVTVSVDDKNIELGSVTTPTDATADGGGLTLRGTTNKTIVWDQANTNWTSSEHWNIFTGKSYKVNNVSVLDATTLGSTVINSSLETLGTISAGTWQGTIIAGQYGGTGVNNTGKTITLGGNFATTSFNLTLVLTGASTITLPTTGTVATLAGTETFTNKTINLTNNTLTGTLAEFNTALSGADFASLAGTETLTNKTVNLANNTLTGTLAQFNTAVSDADLASLSGTETLTNKTVNLANNTLTGTLSQFNAALTGDDFASLTGTETLTNKSINLANNTLTGTLAQFNTALSGADFASLAGSETLTNKTFNLANNTLSGTKALFDTACSDGNFAYHSDKLDVFAATTSAELAGVISDETGTGKLVFADDATLSNVTISDVIKLTPVGAAPSSPSAGMIAVANNAGGGWDPAGVGGSTPYPVFYDGSNWVKMTP